jgi:hypothetical protein
MTFQVLLISPPPLLKTNFQRGVGKINNPIRLPADGVIHVLRRERDSNPRSSYPDNGFRDRPIRPLWHLSSYPLHPSSTFRCARLAEKSAVKAECCKYSLFFDFNRNISNATMF